MSKPKEPTSLDDIFNQVEAELKAEADAEVDTPEKLAAREAKRKEEFERGIRLGWWDTDGNPEEIDEEDDDEEDTD